MHEGIERGEAGASARREYERRAAKREAHLRHRYGALGGLAARVSAEPVHTDAWRKGAEGEAESAKFLERRLRGKGVVLLHDRRIPRTRANIDHLAVGPGGITVIDTKAIGGKVRVVRKGGLFAAKTEHLVVGGRDRTKLVAGVEWQVERVRAAFPDADVRGALCWIKVDGLPLLADLELRGVRIDGPRPIAKVAARPGERTAEEVEALAAEVASAFHAA